jgi:YidC/Oxa1 family membrane protein insertase
MNQELRFLLAISLMILVLVGTNILFPPIPTEELDPTLGADSVPVSVEPGTSDSTPAGVPQSAAPRLPAEAMPVEAPAVDEPEPTVPAREVVVETPLQRLVFSNYGAVLVSAQLPEFESFAREGRVELLPVEDGALGARVEVAGQLVDLTAFPFEVTPAEGLRLSEGSAPQDLTFRYRHPDQPFSFEVTYTFRSDDYLIDVEARIGGVDRPLLLTDLGYGIAYNETKPSEEARSIAYSVNHLQDGVTSVMLSRVDETQVTTGPFVWAALKSKYFLMAVLPGGEGDTETYLGGLTAEPFSGEDNAHVWVTQPTGTDGLARYRLFLGPQNFDRLSAFGNDLEDVNPYGWKVFRPIIRPFVGIVMFVLTGLHNVLGLSYGWVLVVFGVLMRVVLFPLNHKAMRAQMNNMAVQPLLQDIQKRYKDQPERLQKEMMKLYKEHGFNPLAGCLPMLLPWPVLITLFFVFQNTIELRGVPFLWIPSLSAPDPLYILPLVLGLSMFLMQWINVRVTPQVNPQMKMMMWIFPIMFTFIFLNFASGLNLYYAVANIAMLPQQMWIAKERAKVRPLQPAADSD